MCFPLIFLVFKKIECYLCVYEHYYFKFICIKIRDAMAAEAMVAITCMRQNKIK